MPSYRVNEIFRSLQGEGVRAGTVNTFVRFSGCNLTCRKETHGFDCDTEFVSGRTLLCEELLDEMGPPGWCILTGGEPGLQITPELVVNLKAAGWKIAVETNGTVELPNGLDWITVSPKVAEHALRQLVADEVKYVRGDGQGIPKPKVKATYKLISPAFEGNEIDPRALRWCIGLVKDYPEWRLSIQMHKMWNVR